MTAGFFLLSLTCGVSSCLALSPFDPSLLRAEEPPRNYTFSELVRKERTAVVNIRSLKLGREGGGPLKDFFQMNEERFKQEARDGSLGSGFIIASSGLILTNYHVVAPPPGNRLAEEIVARTADMKEYPARVIGKDEKTDVALLQIEGEGRFQAALLGDSDRLEVGEWVMAIGNPFGLEETVTVGVVSGIGRALGAGPYDNFVQTDAAIHPGNSGGPLFNIRGEVVGMNAAINPSGQGIGFAIPINMVKKMLASLVRDGRVTRGWLGVMIQELTADLAKAFKLKDDQGALVSDVMKKSPAERAGVARGDVIISFDGKKIGRMRELPALVAETTVGKTVPVQIIREGGLLYLKVKIVELKEEAP
ncbi:MAG TPA: trypsin-like peptidase domain-containing protein [Candidatus Manganitrophaceae bacterium]|nr:trypsin-like peptidase domain-containing protein [Candidatus Manganitrophaceae bacterium]